ncbi:hypothetical protein M404DRAFT_1006269, partial [Pisolithus tinctorius Marx 270]
MARMQSKKHRRLLDFGKPPGSAPSHLTPQGPSRAPPEDPTLDMETASSVPKGGLAKIKRFFHRKIQSHQTTATERAHTNTDVGPQEQMEQSPAPGTEDTQRPADETQSPPASAAVGQDVEAAVKAFDDINPISRIGCSVISVIDDANTQFTEIENFSDTYLKPFKVFNEIVTTLSNVHPYAKIALGILSAASNLLISQVNRDAAVSSLLNKIRNTYEFLAEDDTIKNIENMKDTLAMIARVISDSAQFIKDYSETKSFWERMGKNILSETQTIADGHIKTLDDLMQQYRDRTIRNIHINVTRVFEDLNLDGMAYAGGAGLNTTKRCLDGTRTEILQQIIGWITSRDVDVPRILWLHGQAGRGKSAIAHTIASWVKEVGAIGSCFCFVRDRQSEHREEKMFTTIARDLAGRDPAFRRALASTLAEDHTLKATPDVAQQWQRLILEPLSKAKGAIVGNVVVVIDALDESGADESRRHILSLLTSTEAASLPANFRILLTSRALPDIEYVLGNSRHALKTCLDDVPLESAERDIRLFVTKEIGHLEGIGSTEINQIAEKANGLFEWARLACEFVRPRRAGHTVKERFDNVVTLQYGEGKTLLDATYISILESGVPTSPVPLSRFRSVMRQLLTVMEPLPMKTLNLIRTQFPGEDDSYDISVILEFMAPVLSGISDHSTPVRPLHASFYDFLTDRSRSGAYFVDISDS